MPLVPNETSAPGKKLGYCFTVELGGLATEMGDG